MRPLAISLSPNTQGKDVLLALKFLFSPFAFFKGDGIGLLEQWFRQYFGVSHAVSFVSGRGAMYTILKALRIGKGDEVILQSFTCVAVPNAILATGAKPCYVDINDLTTINVKDLQKKISKKTKAIIVQHTFGIPSEMDEILGIAKAHKIVVIEDCAHIIGGVYKGKKLGTFGDAAFFSFGRDKAFSSVFGGMAITNNKNLGNTISQLQEKQGYPSFFWVAQQLFHPIAFFFILPLYNFFSLGKIFLFVLQKLSLLSFPVLLQEKQGKTLPVFAKKLPNSLAFLALFQLQRIDIFNNTRKTITEFYIKELSRTGYDVLYKNIMPLLRFPFVCKKREEVLQALKKHGIYVGNWYAEIIDPKGVDLNKVFYKKGMCPNAENIAKNIINLPTYPILKIEDAKKIVEILKNYV